MESIKVLRCIVAALDDQYHTLFERNLTDREQFEHLIRSFKWKDPDQTPKDFSSNWSNWVGDAGKDVKNFGGKNAYRLKKDIAEVLGLPDDIWTNDPLDELLIEKKVGEYIHTLVAGHDASALEQEFFPEVSTLDDIYRELFLSMQTMTEEEINIEVEANPVFAREKQPERQPFLRAIVPFLYTRGMYDILVDNVLDNLFDEHLQSTEIRLIKAHALGFHSDPSRAYEAASILEALKNVRMSDGHERADRTTSFFSNLRRHIFNNIDLRETDLLRYLKELVIGYETACQVPCDYKNRQVTHNLYPSINLAYMAVLGQVLFPDSEAFTRFDIAEIRTLAQPSIDAEKASKDLEISYYAHMAEFEFLLLQGKDAVGLEAYFKNHVPPLTAVKRTKRMVEQFIKRLKAHQLHGTQMVAKMESFIARVDAYLQERALVPLNVLSLLQTKNITQVKNIDELLMLARLVHNPEKFMREHDDIADMLPSDRDLRQFKDPNWAHEILTAAELIAENERDKGKLVLAVQSIKESTPK